MRTQDEILARFTGFRNTVDDMFGFRQEALLEAMTLETAERTGVLKEDFDRSQWTEPDVEKAARGYLLFAVEKAVNHRGLSAGRSIEKLEEWLWVLGDEAALNAFVDAGYAQYGVPKLALLVEAWDMRVAADEAVVHEGHSLDEWRRMARGEPCTPGCDRGCGV